MKTRKFLLGFIFLFTIGLFSSCTKHDRPADLSFDVQTLEFDNSILSRQFSLMNLGDETLFVDAYSDRNWVTVIGSGVRLENAQSSLITVHIDPDYFQEYGVYSGHLFLDSNGGNYTIPITVYYEDLLVYSITFFNPVYTPIEINASGFDPVIVEAGEEVSFWFENNPLSFYYTASTTGSTYDGYPLGIEILWEETIDVSSYDSPAFNLNVSADYFFMAVINTGNYDLDLWSINYGNDYQIDDDFVIPNDGVEYGIAYYDAFSDTDIYAHLVGTEDDVVWSQGIEFVMPWVENQYILLENNFKKSAVSRPSLKSSSDLQLKVKTFKKPKAKSKGSIDLYNKK